MTLELDTQRNVGKQVRKVASRQLKEALQALCDASPEASSQDKAVHTVRKRIKEVRALLRLVRNDLTGKTFTRDNRALRNAARPLSEVRDATALVDALKSLQEHNAAGPKNDAFDPVMRVLLARQVETRRRVLARGAAFRKAESAIRRVRDRIDRWGLQYGARKVLRYGLRETYELGRQAAVVAHKDPSDENLHECRKRAKDLRYQLELLQPLWPERMKTTAEESHKLTDLLGDDHDLAVLSDLLDGEFAKALRPLIDQRRQELQASARLLSEKLYARRELAAD